jgi:transcriptional regulator with XRE-family HTH domain
LSWPANLTARNPYPRANECRARKQDWRNLGRVFREARERSGLSEREVVDVVPGVSLAGVRAIEAGRPPRLNYEQIIRLARVLGVEPSAIVVRAESLSAE